MKSSKKALCLILLIAIVAIICMCLIPSMTFLTLTESILFVIGTEIFVVSFLYTLWISFTEEKQKITN